jgi:NAD(P)-dependent dehydrogenase (short-subunit alcohol dehydrogenase family)
MSVCNKKVVIITGAGQGIGRAVALHLASEGIAVVINDLEAGLLEVLAKEIRANGGQVLAKAGSVTDWAFAEKMVSAAVLAFGRLDGLINNAGLHYSSLPWDEQPERIQQLIDVNVVGSLYCGIHALKVFVAQRSGSVINLSSGAHLGVENQSTYCASKGATASMTYAWAMDAMPFGVRVNAVAPLARTRMTDSLQQYQPDDKLQAPVVEQPSTMGPLFSYLLSDDSVDITGQVIRFNGRDLSILQHPRVADHQETRDDWSGDTMASVFKQTLNEKCSPVGLGATHFQGVASK